MFVCFSVADDNFTAKNASFDEDLTIGVVKCWFNQNKRFHVACDVTRPSTWLREVLSSVAIISHLGVLSVLTQQKVTPIWIMFILYLSVTKKIHKVLVYSCKNTIMWPGSNRAHFMTVRRRNAHLAWNIKIYSAFSAGTLKTATKIWESSLKFQLIYILPK